MIHGLTPALTEAGKIKIGGLGEERQKRGGGTFRLPRKDDHFTVTTTQRGPDGDLVVDEKLMELLPRDHDGKCREIPIVLHSDDIEEVFPTTYALYSGRKLACRGDGQKATRFEIKGGQRTGASKDMACPCDFLEKGTCKPHGTLRCSIRIRERAVAGAVHTWRTTSIISIRRMIGSLMQVRDVVGTLVGVPLVLRVQPVQVSPQGVSASTVYCCHVELRAADLSAVQRQAIESGHLRAQVRASLTYQLPAPGIDESDEEEEEIQQEFHPEVLDPKPPRRASAAGNGHDAEPAETGEIVSDEELIHLSSLIDELDAQAGEGSGLAALADAIGHPDVDLVTTAQFGAAVEALEVALQAARESA